LPYSEIDRIGARMYKGKCVRSSKRAGSDQGSGDGVAPDLHAPLDAGDQ
jgi:hypothetical protein